MHVVFRSIQLGGLPPSQRTNTYVQYHPGLGVPLRGGCPQIEFNDKGDIINKIKSIFTHLLLSNIHTAIIEDYEYTSTAATSTCTS